MASAVQYQSGEASAPLERHVLTVAAIVVLGAIMTVLDATIVSVAIETLSRDFGSPLPTIQWVITGYVLALTAVIPLTGWAADRFGGKRLWMSSLALFVGGSVLCGLAWSAESLILFRVLQGLGGGTLLPAGMTLVAQAAGPKRMGRAMSIVGVPMMLGPIIGPVLGGVLISTVSWRWIFFINVPICLITLLWSWRAMEDSPGRRTERLDVTGLLLLPPGLTALVYGVSALSWSGGFDSPGVLIGWFGGLAMLVLFVAHALRADRPLLDLRHFANRTFSAAATIQALLGAVLHGSMLLLPLYYQVVRGEPALNTGLLLMPQGLGAAASMMLTGRLVDKGKGRTVSLAGLLVMIAGFVPYTQSSPNTSYLLISASLFVLGLGTGCLTAPIMSAAYQTLDPAAIPRATSTLSITMRVGGALGTALYAVILQHNLTQARAAGTTNLPDAVADAFGRTFWWPLALTAVAVLPTLLLPGNRPTQHQAPTAEAERSTSDDQLMPDTASS
jgi:EmrB/QacA subfamily drug resistance transporter